MRFIAPIDILKKPTAPVAGKKYKVVFDTDSGLMPWEEDTSTGIPEDVEQRIVDLEELTQTQQETIEAQAAQIVGIENNQAGIEVFPLQNALAVGDLYYKTDDDTFVSSSPATSETSKYRGIVWKVIGGDITAIRAGSPLSAEQIDDLNASGLTLDSFGLFYMGSDGRPDSEPPTEFGYKLKEVISSGRLNGDSQGTTIGEEVYKQIVVTASGTITLEEYLERLTVIGNSASAIALVPAAGLDSQRVTFHNKGAGNMTITGTFSGSTNPVLTTNQTQTLEYSDMLSAWIKV